MSDVGLKPLNWEPDPNIGYTVVRRPDGGMNFTFTDVSSETIAHWRDFSLQHLYDSDRLTRNLYDLRQVGELNEKAIRVAIEVNSDPSTLNIRLAVVVPNEEVRKGIRKIADLATSTGVDMAIFTDIDEAETWLGRPLTMVV
jgi:hypothetical protein